MGTYTELTMGGYPLISSKSAVVAEVMTVFQETDRRIVSRRVSERNPLVWGQPSQGDEEHVEEAIEYACTAAVAAERLDVMGFTVARAKQEFEAERECQIQEWSSDEGELGDWATRHLQTLGRLSFEAYRDGLRHIVANSLRSLPFDDYQDPALDPVVKYMLSSEDSELGFLGSDLRLLIRLMCTLLPRDSEVIQDISGLVSAGYYREDEPVCSDAKRSLLASHPDNAPVIILTEGSRDGMILKAALSLLHRHLVDYYSFLDFNAQRVQGGAGQLVSFLKAFAAAGVSNRVIAIFDNDTAAREATRHLATVTLPTNVRWCHYPDLEFLRQYPAIGPNGLVLTDVNGLAASIELYLGRNALLDKNGRLTPIHWKGYSDALDSYQGEIRNKQLVHASFDALLDECRVNPERIATVDLSGLGAIWQRLITLFD